MRISHVSLGSQSRYHGRRASSLRNPQADWSLTCLAGSYAGIRRPLLSRRNLPNSSNPSSCSAVKIGPSMHTKRSSSEHASQMPIPHFMYRSRLAWIGIVCAFARSTTAFIIRSGPHVRIWSNFSRSTSFSARAGTNPAKPRDPSSVAMWTSPLAFARSTNSSSAAVFAPAAAPTWAPSCAKASNLGMGDPDRFRDGSESGVLEEGRHLLRDLLEDGEAFRDDRGADLDRAGTGHDVLQGVPSRPDSADADHGDVDLLADVVHRAHADRPDRGTAEPSELVREEGHLQLGDDRHGLHRVDRDDAVRAAFFGRDRERGDVLDVRR